MNTTYQELKEQVEYWNYPPVKEQRNSKKGINLDVMYVRTHLKMSRKGIPKLRHILF